MGFWVLCGKSFAKMTHNSLCDWYSYCENTPHFLDIVSARRLLCSGIVSNVYILREEDDGLVAAKLWRGVNPRGTEVAEGGARDSM